MHTLRARALAVAVLVALVAYGEYCDRQNEYSVHYCRYPAPSYLLALGHGNGTRCNSISEAPVRASFNIDRSINGERSLVRGSIPGDE